jgi:hypothetical protein
MIYYTVEPRCVEVELIEYFTSKQLNIRVVRNKLKVKATINGTSVYFVISKRYASEILMCLGFDHYNCLKSDINMWVMLVVQYITPQINKIAQMKHTIINNIRNERSEIVRQHHTGSNSIFYDVVNGPCSHVRYP